jgi:hypothetical protein
MSVIYTRVNHRSLCQLLDEITHYDFISSIFYTRLLGWQREPKFLVYQSDCGMLTASVESPKTGELMTPNRFKEEVRKCPTPHTMT